jgi:hypothetical protein
MLTKIVNHQYTIRKDLSRINQIDYYIYNILQLLQFTITTINKYKYLQLQLFTITTIYNNNYLQ